MCAGTKEGKKFNKKVYVIKNRTNELHYKYTNKKCNLVIH